ncbi:MAG: DUF4270 family protein [Bacteroidota bacterium]|nr:DUF4270 family protein [Bacteroidota bacterium]
MKKRQLSLTIGLFITSVFILFTSCRKINEATELGSDLIPPVDNITTFDTTLSVEAYNGLFTLSDPDPTLLDSTRGHYSDEQFLGLISNDPFFGKTDARMFFELKPPSFKYTFLNTRDSIYIDSVVLVLNYVETYGDSTAQQTVKVYEMPSELRVDTGFLTRQDPFGPSGIYGQQLGSKTFIPAGLKDSVKAFQDTTASQLRIPLDTVWGSKLLRYDTSGGSNDAYSSDSLFTDKFKGFALQSTSGNAIMGFNLTGANTKLAIYYKYAHGKGLADLDTTVAYFSFKPYDTYLLAGSAAANYIQRDYSGTPLLAAQGGTTPDPFVYIQNTPGSFATIKVPGLAGMNNCVVHRAELIAEEVYDISDNNFTPPANLFLDAYDSSLSKYLLFPYDLSFNSSGGLSLTSFGVAPINALDGSGNAIKTWHFDISRYIQHVVNKTEHAYNFRIFSPFYVSEQYRPVTGATPVTQIVTVNPGLAKGRVRLAGGTGPQRMRLRIVYSRL